MIDLTAHEDGTILSVRGQPSARSDGILGERAGALRIGVTVAPEKGQANEAIVRILAETLGCRGSSLVMLSGETSRDKRFLVLGLDPEAVRARIEPLIP